MTNNQSSESPVRPVLLKKKLARLQYHLNALWLFFPGIMMLLIGLFALTGLEQGKDLMVTSVESIWAPGFSLAAVSFWAFISWYTARLVSQEKIKRNDKDLTGPYQSVPRGIGLGCYFVFETSILNLRFFNLNFWFILIIITIAYLLLIRIGKRLIFKGLPVFEKWPFRSFVVVLAGFIIIIDIISFFLRSYSLKLMSLCIAHFFTGLLFVNFTYFRRIYLDRKNRFRGTMFKMSIREQEEDFLVAFAVILSLGFIIYILPVISPALAEWIGSLNFFLTGLGIMLFIGNFLAFYSIKTGINLHLIVFLGLFLAGFLIDPYQINTIQVENPLFSEREPMEQYFESWYESNKTFLDDTGNTDLPVYVSLADGGASRSGYWVSQILGTLEDSIGISKHLLCISGASGGSVGNLAYFNLLVRHHKGSFRIQAAKFLKHDFLTFTLSRMISPVYFINDRGNALEKALAHGNPEMNNLFSGYILKGNDASLPIVYVNTTRMQDSHPAVVSNIKFIPEQLNGRLDVLHILDSLKMDIRLSSVAILSSRFPYVSPAGGIGKDYFVDGGYFDNSGAGAVHETLLSLMQFMRVHHPSAINKIRIKVIHISNSTHSFNELNRVNPLVNDLAAPLQVLMASYGQQTEINTLRLHRYLKETGNFNDSTDWYDINLYAPNAKAEYSMNWYMSDDCRKRIDSRLNAVLNARLHDLIIDYRSYWKSNF